jgi:hypothetical protein
MRRSWAEQDIAVRRKKANNHDLPAIARGAIDRRKFSTLLLNSHTRSLRIEEITKRLRLESYFTHPPTQFQTKQNACRKAGVLKDG